MALGQVNVPGTAGIDAIEAKQAAQAAQEAAAAALSAAESAGETAAAAMTKANDAETKAADAETAAGSAAAAGVASVTFTADDWTGDDEPYTLTVPQTSHKRTGTDFIFDAYSLGSDGKYVKNTWAVLELDVEYTEATGDFKLYSDTKFAGKLVFAG